MGSERKEREEGDGSSREGPRTSLLPTGNSVKAQNPEERWKQEHSPGKQQHCPLSTPTPTPTRAVSPSLHLCTCCKGFPTATSGH